MLVKLPLTITTLLLTVIVQDTQIWKECHIRISGEEKKCLAQVLGAN